MAILGCLLQSPVQATIHYETLDAGEVLATAQITQGVGSLNQINAHLIDLGNKTDDVDLFKITISDPENFSVSVIADLTKDNDATLYLFNSTGHQILFDDDGDGEDLFPEFTAGSLSGFNQDIYYLGFSLVLTEPFFLGDSLIGWRHEPDLFQTGGYSLELSGTEFAAPVPVPNALLLFSSGFMILLGKRKRG